MTHPDQDFQSEATGRDSPTSRRRHMKKGTNPLDSRHLTRLRESMSWSDQQFRPFRERNVQTIELYAGNRYGYSDLDKTPMNMMRLAVDVWLRQLAAQTPRCLVLTRQPNLRVDAYELELAIDHLLREILFGSKLSECVLSSIFSMGIMKVGITSKYLAEGSGFTADAGQPYADPVLFDDWLHDANARNIEECDWCGNKYCLPYDMVMENPDFSDKVKKQLTPDDESDPTDNFGATHKKTSQISREESIIRTEYKKRVWLWDLWLPGDDLFVTIPCQNGLDPLQVREWEGPENGPFHILSLSKLPGNIMASAPAQHLAEMQIVLTQLFNQLVRQAQRQKTITLADGRAEADGTAERIMEAEDGHVISTSHVDGVKEMNYGGIHKENYGFVVWLREMMSYLGGNIDAMGGLAQQAGTLGQEQLLVQSSSEMIRDMQSKVITFTGKVIKDLAWYMYSDPLIELPLVKRIESYGDIPFTWTPEDREADFFEYSFEIQPYSLQQKSPQQRLQSIMQYVTQLFIPLAPQMEAWGQHLNLEKLMETLSKYSDLPELQEIITSETPTMAEQVQGPQESNAQRVMKAPVSQRNYTRQSIKSGGTQQNKDQKMIQGLMKGGSNDGGSE